MGNALNLRGGALLLSALLACAACTSNPAPTPTATLFPTATLHLNTHEGPIQQATLPPSWTPTFTLTPSRTPTPTPVTPTATSTPVPSLDELCESFTVDAGFEDGHIFVWDDTISVMFGTPLRLVRDPATSNVVPVRLRFMATHVDSEETLGVQGTGGQTHAMELAASRLTHPGYYTWKAVVYDDSFGEQCAHEGNFYVYPTSEDVPTATPTPAPGAAEVCDSFVLDYDFEDGHIFLWNDTITFSLGTPLTVARDPDTDAAVPLLVQFVATNNSYGGNFVRQMFPGEIVEMVLRPSDLERTGYYTWKAFISMRDVADVCTHEGNFHVYFSHYDLTRVAATAES